MKANPHEPRIRLKAVWRIAVGYLSLGLALLVLAGIIDHTLFGHQTYDPAVETVAGFMAVFILLSTLIVVQEEKRFLTDLRRRERIRRVQQEQALKFRLIAENSVDLISMAGLDGQMEYVSPSHQMLLGFEPQALLNRHPASLIHPVDLERIGDWHRYPLSEFRLAMSDGGWRWVQGYRYLIQWEGRDYSVGIARDVTTLRTVQKTVIEYAERLRLLSRKLLETQENERRHLARELHDEVGQTLTATKLGLHAMSDLFQLSRREKLYEELVANLDRVLTQVRSLSLNLHPSLLDDLGLVAAVRGLGSRMATLSGLKLTLDLPTDNPRFPPLVEITCYRVVQEALNNIARHAGAIKVELALRADGDELRVTIRDDGHGFDVEAMRRKVQGGSSLGLLGMEERVQLAGGHFDLVSAPGQGTTIALVFAQGQTAGEDQVEVEEAEKTPVYENSKEISQVRDPVVADGRIRG
jgi:PAS domain S-box-containing protein